MPKRYKFFVFLFCDCIVKILGACNTPLERCFQDLSNGILQAPKSLKLQLVNPKNICCCLAIVEEAGQKNRNGKITAVFFS